jgi:ATP-dependent DNA helicase RecG
MLTLNNEIAQIKGLAPRFLAKLNKLHIRTVRDLLWHFPTRYEDFSAVMRITDLEGNQNATIQGVVRKVGLRRTMRKHMVIVEAQIMDDTGAINAIWFNQPYIAKTLRPGRLASFAGKVAFAEDGLYLSNPSYELINSFSSETKHTAGLIPIYPETKGLTSKGLRYLTKPILSNLMELEDFIPEEVLRQHGFPEINTALRSIHFPKNLEEATAAKRRFTFEDLFLLQLNNIKTRLELAKEKAPKLTLPPKELADILAKLPFALTTSQQQSLNEILVDLGAARPMNRLLQGDVGSGKTVIAAIAAIAAAKSRHQAAFMAPTEVLASQHYKTLAKIFGHLRIPTALATGAHTKIFFEEGLEAELSKKELAKKIAAGEVKIVIGTHAIIQKNIIFDSLALAVVDEQHRFGVRQRATLLSHKQKYIPHFLSMSATPIPRTLMLTIFGDLDLSLITELPKGRKAIITKVVSPENRAKAYAFIRGEIQKGRQAFVICPRIEKAEAQETDTFLPSHLNWNDVKAVKEEYERLKTKVFPDLRIAMLHGKLKPKEKSVIMADFSAGKYNILVSTSVVEVGVDIPNASIMMIEGAERFGLSQLYQFRGRVGRGAHQSFCLLFTDSHSEATEKRLQSLVEAKNGFELAEKDLAIRGPGEFLGSHQTGIPDGAMDALGNMELVKTARAAAVAIVKKDQGLKAYPPLLARYEEFAKKIHLE